MRWRYKRLHYLWGRVASSIALRGVKGTVARVMQQLQRRAQEAGSLPLLPLCSHTDGLAFPVPSSPIVSIVIPVHGKLDYTVTCLRSLSQHSGDPTVEVIVVDDASPDHSAEALRTIA